MVQIGNITKFSFGEMTSNDNGKTSATSTAGSYIIFIGGIAFLLGVGDKMWGDKTIDIINQAVVVIGIGAALLGVKIWGNKGETSNNINAIQNEEINSK
jgi:hypothetical protein